MRFHNPILAAAIVLLFGVGGYALSQVLTTSNPSATPERNAGSLPMSQQAGFQAAADRVAGFNLLSNNPPVPDIEMHEEDGRPVTFARFKGKVVLLNLWATWCPPCIREMPDLNTLQAQYRDRDFIVVPVASGRQGREEPSEFFRKYGLKELTTYYDPHSQFLRLFELETLPISFLIDRNGIMRGGVIGLLDWSSDEAKALIEVLLDERKT